MCRVNIDIVSQDWLWYWQKLNSFVTFTIVFYVNCDHHKKGSMSIYQYYISVLNNLWIFKVS